MTSLLQTLSGVVEDVFEAAGLPRELGACRVSDRPDLAQFQCNGAMAAAKIAGKNPREIAQGITDTLAQHQMITHCEIAGPGFININVSDDLIGEYTQDLPQVNIGAGATVVLDYGGPNVAKALHAGHLRPAIIGDAVRRIMDFAGFKTLGDVHFGDWGTPMGMIINEVEKMHPDLPYFDADFTGPYPEESPVSVTDLEEIYPRAAAACKESPDCLTASKDATVDLQNKRPGYYALWQHFVKVSIDGTKAIYDRLDVHFDLWKGEADVHDLIAPMVEGLTKKGLAEDSGGAVVVPVAREDDKKEIPPLILYKRDGAVMYGTTDLATIVERVDLYDPARIIYVVDQRQHLHFEQVFRAARMSDIAPESIELTHAGFGTMNGPDGKPFKTRDGGIMRLEAFMDMIDAKALERLNEADLAKDIDGTARDVIAHKIALAAIKFADLQNPRQSDYIFDTDKLTQFEGRTGPYILYQAVRLKSLLAKAGEQENGTIIIDDMTRPLCLIMAQFPDIIAASIKQYAPHVLCDYIYRLAAAFSSFYGNCHILSEEDSDIRASRLALCALIHTHLEASTNLIGIEIPERM